MHTHLLGAHCSAAGGANRAVARIVELHGKALQLFTRNQRQWNAPPVNDAEVAAFSAARKAWGDYPVAAHDGYLINLASPEEAVRKRSIAGFKAELERCSRLGIRHLVTHPGAHKGQGVEAGIAAYVHSLDTALDAVYGSAPFSEGDTPQVRVLLETMAGQGTCLGARFEELGAIIAASRHKHRLGVCLDTCHIFAAGYELRTPQAYERTMERFAEVIGFEKLGLVHLNDSKNPFGSRKDRHEHIGQGEMGVQPFRLLLRDARFSRVPMVIETPKDKAGTWDFMNLNILRLLMPRRGTRDTGKR